MRLLVGEHLRDAHLWRRRGGIAGVEARGEEGVELGEVGRHGPLGVLAASVDDLEGDRRRPAATAD